MFSDCQGTLTRKGWGRFDIYLTEEICLSRIIISTESGSDLPWKISVPNCIEILPMHVTFGRKMFYDGEFDVAEAEQFFKESNKLPVTSAPNLGEYSAHFMCALNILLVLLQRAIGHENGALG